MMRACGTQKNAAPASRPLPDPSCHPSPSPEGKYGIVVKVNEAHLRCMKRVAEQLMMPVFYHASQTFQHCEAIVVLIIGGLCQYSQKKKMQALSSGEPLTV